MLLLLIQLDVFFFLPVLSCRLNYFSEQKHKIHILKEYLYTCGWSQTAWLCWFLISYFSRSFSAFPSCWTADQDLLYNLKETFLLSRNEAVFRANGALTQYLYGIPAKMLIECPENNLSQWQVVFKSISRRLKMKTDHIKLVLLVTTDLVQSLHEIQCIFSTHSMEMIS